MKIYVVEVPNGPFREVDIKNPEPGPGQVLVRIWQIADSESTRSPMPTIWLQKAAKARWSLSIDRRRFLASAFAASVRSAIRTLRSI
jgi:hypothetical protein